MIGQPSYCGIILATGPMSRLGADVALCPWPPGALTGTVLSAHMEALAPRTEMIMVVTGENEVALRGVVYARAGYIVRDPNPSPTQFSSLRFAAQAVLDRGHDGAVILSAERAPVKKETIARLQDSFAEQSEENVWGVLPSYQQETGLPLVIGRDMIEVLLRSQPLSSLAEVVATHAGKLRSVEVDDSNVIAVINPESIGPAEVHLT